MVTKEEIEQILGSIDRYSVQEIVSDFDDNGDCIHTIIKDGFYIYLSELKEVIDNDNFSAVCYHKDSNEHSFIFIDETLENVFSPIKSYMTSCNSSSIPT